MHRTRKQAPKVWGIASKGTKYVARGSGNKEIPLVIALRDILGFTKTKKEVKAVLNQGYVKVNNSLIKDEKFLLKLNDIISLKNKHFRVVFNEFKKFGFLEIQEKETNEKIARVINKKILKQGKIQINLSDGRNYVVESNKKFNVGDSCVVDLKNKNIKEVLKLEKNSRAVIIEGKHIGKSGKIISVDEEKKVVGIETKNGEINVKIEQIQVEK